MSISWPITAPEQLAFRPGRETTEVPVLPKEQRLTWATYLDRLRSRLKWMLRTPEDQQLYRQMMEERAGVDVAVKRLEDHVLTPEFQQLLAENLVQPEMFPLHPKPQPEARESILETDLQGWLEMFLPAHPA